MSLQQSDTGYDASSSSSDSDSEDAMFAKIRRNASFCTAWLTITTTSDESDESDEGDPCNRVGIDPPKKKLRLENMS